MVEVPVVSAVVREHLRRGRGRCSFPEVVRHRFAIGAAIHHEASATDVAGARQGDRECEPGRDRGIDGVATVSEHAEPGFRREHLL
jgi:hypothetical protein